MTTRFCPGIQSFVKWGMMRKNGIKKRCRKHWNRSATPPFKSLQVCCRLQSAGASNGSGQAERHDRRIQGGHVSPCGGAPHFRPEEKTGNPSRRRVAYGEQNAHKILFG